MTRYQNTLIRRALLKAFAKEPAPPSQAMVVLMDELANALREREHPFVKLRLKQ